MRLRWLAAIIAAMSWTPAAMAGDCCDLPYRLELLPRDITTVSSSGSAWLHVDTPQAEVAVLVEYDQPKLKVDPRQQVPMLVTMEKFQCTDIGGRPFIVASGSDVTVTVRYRDRKENLKGLLATAREASAEERKQDERKQCRRPQRPRPYEKAQLTLSATFASDDGPAVQGPVVGGHPGNPALGWFGARMRIGSPLSLDFSWARNGRTTVDSEYQTLEVDMHVLRAGLTFDILHRNRQLRLAPGLGVQYLVPRERRRTGTQQAAWRWVSSDYGSTYLSLDTELFFGRHISMGVTTRWLVQRKTEDVGVAGETPGGPYAIPFRPSRLGADFNLSLAF